MSNSFDRTLLFLGIAWVRTLCGLFIATTSISIPVLAHNVDSSLGTTSWMFTCRIFGAFVGGVLGSTFAKKANPNKLFAAATFVAAVALYWTPSITSLTVLLIVSFLFGVIHGLIDSIGQMIILNHALNPGRYILGFHALFTFGSILGALLIRIFLDPTLEQPCPNDPRHYQKLILLPEVLNSFQYAFILPAYALFAAVLMQLLQVCLNTYEKVDIPKTSMSNCSTVNEPIKPSNVFLSFYIITLFFAATSYQVTFSFLHPFTRCDHFLQVSSEESATNVIWYWLANMLGRFFVMYLLHKNYNVRTIFTCVSSLLVVIQLFLEFAPLSAYVFMALEDVCGFLLSGVIPLCIVYASSIFDLCDGYMWTIYVGCNLLCMFNPVGIGFWMTIDTRGFVHALLISCCSLFLFQQLMFCSAKTVKTPLAQSSSSSMSLKAASSALSIKI